MNSEDTKRICVTQLSSPHVKQQFMRYPEECRPTDPFPRSSNNSTVQLRRVTETVT
jgi:hypothetical protein